MIMMLASLVLPFLFALAAYGPSLVMFLLYLSVRHHPTAPVSLFGFVTLQSVYLPWAFLVLGFAGLGGDPRGVGLGILAGHVVWFLTDVFPRGGGRALLARPGLPGPRHWGHPHARRRGRHRQPGRSRVQGVCRARPAAGAADRVKIGEV